MNPVCAGIPIVGDDATLLHFAACYDVPESVTVLLDHDADIFATACDATTGNLHTALDVAVYLAKVDHAAAILQHPSFATADAARRQQLLNRSLLTPPRNGRWEERERLLTMLLRCGADLHAQTVGVTPVQAAASRISIIDREGDAAVREEIDFLQRHGAKLDLFSAIALDDEECVRRLLVENPIAIEEHAPDGRPLLHVAIELGRENIVRRLLDAGADVNEPWDDWQTRVTVEQAAPFWGQKGYGNIRFYLLNAKLPMRGSTPLHVAVREFDFDVAKLLVSRGAQSDAQDASGKTPLEWRRVLKEDGDEPLDQLLLGLATSG